MAIKFVIDEPGSDLDKEERSAPQKTIHLKSRKSLDGNIMIMDHELIDIVVMPQKSKIVTFMKSSQNDLAYETQDRFFKFLHKKGLILPETIKVGNVYGSLEGNYPTESDYANPLNISLMLVSEFIEDEKQFMGVIEYVEDNEEERLTDPDADDSTELGEIPHKEKKGSLGMIDYYPAYYYGHIYE